MRRSGAGGAVRGGGIDPRSPARQVGLRWVEFNQSSIGKRLTKQLILGTIFARSIRGGARLKKRIQSARPKKLLRFSILLVCVAFGIMRGSTVFAKAVECRTNLAGEEISLQFDTESIEYRSLREHWSPFAPSCPSAAIIARLKPDIAPELRKGYCLLSDQETGAYLAAVPGVGDRFGRCAEDSTVCKAVNNLKDYAITTGSGLVGTIVGSNAALAAAGVSVVEHSSGALILTGSSGYIAGTLGTGATTAVGIATAPATLVGAASGAVVVGGALLICRE